MGKNLHQSPRPKGVAYNNQVRIRSEKKRPGYTDELARFNISFDILRYAALRYPSGFTRQDVFDELKSDVAIRTQQRILQRLCEGGYLAESKQRDARIKIYTIKTRAFLPFMAMSSAISKQ